MPEFNHSKACAKDRPIDRGAERAREEGCWGRERVECQNSVSPAEAWNFCEGCQNPVELNNRVLRETCREIFVGRKKGPNPRDWGRDYFSVIGVWKKGNEANQLPEQLTCSSNFSQKTAAS